MAETESVFLSNSSKKRKHSEDEKCFYSSPSPSASTSSPYEFVFSHKMILKMENKIIERLYSVSRKYLTPGTDREYLSYMIKFVSSSESMYGISLLCFASYKSDIIDRDMYKLIYFFAKMSTTIFDSSVGFKKIFSSKKMGDGILQEKFLYLPKMCILRRNCSLL